MALTRIRKVERSFVAPTRLLAGPPGSCSKGPAELEDGGSAHCHSVTNVQAASTGQRELGGDVSAGIALREAGDSDQATWVGNEFCDIFGGVGQ